MPVIGKRFKPFEDTYNLAASKFGAGVDSAVVNDKLNELKDSADNLLGLVKNSIPSGISDLYNEGKGALEGYAGLYDEAKGAVAGYADLYKEGKGIAEGYVRDIKGVAGKVIDYAKMPEKVFDKFLGNVTGIGSPYTKPIGDVLRKCGKGSNYSYGGRPYDISMSCKGNTASLGGFGSGSSCSAANFSNLIDGLTGGSYSSGFKDISSALNVLTGLATQGYNFGMCGILNGLKGADIFSKFNLGNTELSKVGGTLLGITGSSGNLNGWLDVASSSVGMNLLSVNPNGVSDLFKNFTLPSSTSERDLLSLGERTLAGLELVDPDWNVSDLGDMSSIADMVGFDGITDDFRDVAEACLCDRDFGVDDLDFIPDGDDMFTYAAASADFDLDWA